MDKIKLVKDVVSLVVGVSVGHAATSIVNNNLNPRNVRERIEIAVAGYVIGAMVADAARDWCGNQIDDLVNWYDKTFKNKDDEVDYIQD